MGRSIEKVAGHGGNASLPPMLIRVQGSRVHKKQARPLSKLSTRTHTFSPPAVPTLFHSNPLPRFCDNCIVVRGSPHYWPSITTLGHRASWRFTLLHAAELPLLPTPPATDTLRLSAFHLTGLEGLQVELSSPGWISTPESREHLLVNHDCLTLADVHHQSSVQRLPVHVQERAGF